MLRTVYLAVLAAAALWLISCTSSIPKPTAMHRQWTREHYGAEIDVERGYTLYVANCSGCHSLYPPSQYADSTWARVFPEMRNKAKLNQEDAGLVLAYITSASALAKAH